MPKRLSPLLLLALLLNSLPVSAHANLLRSEPPANGHVESAPEAILLWFTEPVEPQFSQITLRDAQGSLVETSPAHVNPSDHTQLVLIPGDLPDGVYTVAWRVVSQTDGHSTQGSYPVTVGAATGKAQVISEAASQAIPPESALIRWFNLLSLALLAGSVAFRVFVWGPSIIAEMPEIEQ